MKGLHWLGGVVSVLAVALLTSGAAESAEGRLPARDLTVVLLSLDGFPASLLDDPYLPAPTLRRLMREGAVARRMGTINPAVTWPNHATLVTGVNAARHGVLFNGLLVRGGERAPVTVDQRERSELLRAPTVYDLAHAAGLTTAQVNWIPHQVDGTIGWAFHERPRPDGSVEREMIAEGVLLPDDLPPRGKGNNPWRDHLRSRAAAHILRKHRPNLLLLHFLNLDDVHHRYGHGSPAGHTAVALLDAQIASLVGVLDSGPLRGRSTLLIVSDHGFKKVRRVIRPNARLRELGLLQVEGARTTGSVYAVSEGGTAMVYGVDAAGRARMPALVETFATLEGVERVVEPEGFPALGLPAPSENAQMADLVLVARDGYAFDALSTGPPVSDVGPTDDRGAHGYVASDPDMDALFVAYGRGIRPGVTLDRIANVDVAPTVGALLGLEMPGAAGRPLAAILADSP